ncbi:hypothetical protein GN244_ATG10602 [Phytophthora infestans]|uniref:Uncharacterized protein n=1 Tax=Phytophthora infestans TaxID=4787 RepID=A0A833SSA0_PHYIN|nr:hypothetical protein GN244_ATG10602 [Phytophthora infestans]KAF4131489.1 hypothetical protein GN958_ATG19318 [Phytophthora infestans]KAF4139869.1 hypothetical protein GN958_ATG10942 [Phytophthora infestans]
MNKSPKEPLKASATHPEDDYKPSQSVVKVPKTETPRKRPFAASSKLAVLRSVKRRLKDSGTTRKRLSDATNIDSRVTTQTRSTGAQNDTSPVLLEESRYWLVVQRFSQLA